MANPLVFFENILEDGTMTQPAGTAASGFPLANLLDWRMATPFRWKAGETSAQLIRVDLGGGITAQPNTFSIGGHNLSTVGATFLVEWSDNDSAWTAAFSAVTPSSDLPHMKTFSVGAAHRYWRVSLPTGGFSAAPQIGILTLGRRVDFEAGANPDLDPYGVDMQVEDSTNNEGSPIGVNVLHRTKNFQIRYGGGSDPGMTKSGFWRPASGLKIDTDFVAHALTSAKPFWFAWNIDEDADEIWLCRTRQHSTPFVGSTARRGWSIDFMGYREVA